MEAKEILTSHNKFHISLGLDRIKKILTLLDNPQEKYEIIHIAGTNGKGSTSKLINNILIEHCKNKNINIGLYTSPHLFSYNERIKINNEDISDYIFNKLIKKIDKLASSNNIELSEFELLTACAFYYFYIKNAKYVVLETGLGGLFDATNIIKKPAVTVITTIDFDHTERLGNTIEKIAQQKAGIIKKNTNVVVSKENLGYEIIKNAAIEKEAKLIELDNIENKFEDNNYVLINNKKYKFSLLGSHQTQNLALALAAVKCIIEINDNILQSVLKNTHWKFRLEYNKEKKLIIDCAHNPSGIQTLRNFLDENFKNTQKTFVFGCLKNKDYQKMLEILIKPEDELYFMEFNYPNALKFDELNYKQAKKLENIEDIIKKDNLKIFCGSIYMLGNIFNPQVQ